MGFFEMSRTNHLIPPIQICARRKNFYSAGQELRRDMPYRNAFCKNENLRSAPAHFVSRFDPGVVCTKISLAFYISPEN